MYLNKNSEKKNMRWRDTYQSRNASLMTAGPQLASLFVASLYHLPAEESAPADTKTATILPAAWEWGNASIKNQQQLISVVCLFTVYLCYSMPMPRLYIDLLSSLEHQETPYEPLRTCESVCEAS